MPVVKVQKKGQVTLPVRLRAKAGIAEGDLVEVQIEHGKITFTPKSLVDRHIAESLEDYKKGRSYGLFETAEGMIASLKANLKKRSKRVKRS